jgi:hypothetical protein
LVAPKPASTIGPALRAPVPIRKRKVRADETEGPRKAPRKGKGKGKAQARAISISSGEEESNEPEREASEPEEEEADKRCHALNCIEMTWDNNSRNLLLFFVFVITQIHCSTLQKQL